MKPAAPRPQFIRAAVSLVAVIASFSTVYALCRATAAQPGPAILSAILAMSLARRDNATDRRQLATAPFAIAIAACAAAAVGWLLLRFPLAGAVAFVTGIFLSIYLRNFDEPWGKIGSLIALPLIGILVTPGRADAPGGVAVDIGLYVAAGIAALFVVTLVQSIARRAGWITIDIRPVAVRRPEAMASVRAMPTPTTRLAIQMAVALGAAFAIGYAVFPQHWGWTVLTAFIVASGARGRGDVAYRSLQRLGGAMLGTVAAAVLVHLWLPAGVGEAVVIFGVLFAGFALRDVNYAYWALCMTLVLALLSRPSNAPDVSFLGIRLEAILAGAVCSVAAAWFVLPIRTTAVVRKRLSEALLALDDYVANAHLAHEIRSEKLETFGHRMADLELVAPPVRLHRSVFARSDTTVHPASWIDLAHRLRERADALEPERAANPIHRGSLRRAIGLSRRAIGNHGKRDAAADVPSIGRALEALHAVFEAP